MFYPFLIFWCLFFSYLKALFTNYWKMSNFFPFVPVKKISSHNYHKYWCIDHYLEKLITAKGGYESPDDPAQELAKFSMPIDRKSP